MAETPLRENQESESQRRRRWRAPLVTLVIYLLTIETWSGFALFFFGPFLNSTGTLGAAHWWLGVAFLGPYGVYQLRHYLRVRPHAGRIHFRIGLSTFVLMTTVFVSGVLMWLADDSRDSLYYVVVDLTHIMMGFALLIMLSSHLVLVFKVGRRQERELGSKAVIRGILNRVVWLPTTVAILLVIGWIYLTA